MKVFIFDMSWEYCGGMAVAIATTYKRACELIQEYLNKNGDPKAKYEFLKGSPPQKSVDYITFLRELPTSETEEWAFANYNYA